MLKESLKQSDEEMRRWDKVIRQQDDFYVSGLHSVAGDPSG
jgi:hypothetical protein